MALAGDAVVVVATVVVVASVVVVTSVLKKMKH